MDKLYLSICIPALSNRVEYLKKTLDSILLDCECNLSEFEIVISDNSEGNEILNLLERYKGFYNIYFYKTDSVGFMNSINSLKLGRGLLLKLHNDYTCLEPGSLKYLIDFIKLNEINKPVTFFTNGNLQSKNILKFDNFNIFLNKLVFWCTWSTGFSIWEVDFSLHREVKLMKLFPHTSLLFKLFYKSNFVINDLVLFKNQNVISKGGYNLFYAFCVEFLNSVKELRRSLVITENTYTNIKKKLFFDFLVDWYIATNIKKNNYNYDLSNIPQNVNYNFGKIGFLKLVLFSKKKIYIQVVKKWLKSVVFREE